MKHNTHRVEGWGGSRTLDDGQSAVSGNLNRCLSWPLEDLPHEIIYLRLDFVRILDERDKWTKEGIISLLNFASP